MIPPPAFRSPPACLTYHSKVRSMPFGPLLSFQPARWDVERTGSPGHYRYRLTPTSEARQFAAKLHKEAQADFEAEAAIRLEFARMTPEQRKSEIKRFLKATHQSDATGNVKDFYTSPDGDIVWSGLRAFSESLSPEQQRRILQTQEPVKIPITSLSPASQEYVRGIWKMMIPYQILPDGTHKPVPTPEPVDVTFQTKWNSHVRKYAAPALFLYIGETAGGYSYIGGTALNAHRVTQAADLWLLSGDAQTDAANSREVRKPEKPEEEPIDYAHQDASVLNALIQSGKQPPMARWGERRLGQVSEGAGVSTLGRLPIVQNEDEMGLPFGRSVADCLEKLTAKNDYMTKWRDHILLVNYPTWYEEDGFVAPYRLIKQLRGAQKRGGGTLPFADFAMAVNRMENDSLDLLALEFPLFHRAGDARPMCKLFELYPELVRKGGINVTPELQTAWQHLRLPPHPAIVNGTAQSLRVTSVLENGSTQLYRLEYLNAERKWVLIMSYIQQATARK